MQIQTFYRELEAALEVAPNTIHSGEEPLATLCNWDSMALLTFIGLADEKLSLEINPGDLGQCKTPKDLAQLCRERLVF